MDRQPIPQRPRQQWVRRVPAPKRDALVFAAMPKSRRCIELRTRLTRAQVEASLTRLLRAGVIRKCYPDGRHPQTDVAYERTGRPMPPSLTNPAKRSRRPLLSKGSERLAA